MQLLAQPSFIRLVGQPISKNGHVLTQNNPCIVVSQDLPRIALNQNQTTLHSDFLQKISEQIRFSDSFVYEKHFIAVFNLFPSLLSNNNEERNIHSFEDYSLFLRRLIRSHESQYKFTHILFLSKLLEIVEERKVKEKKILW
jgi:hypothetical protein